MRKLKIIIILSAMIALNSCMIPEVYEAHGLRGVFTDNGKANPYLVGKHEEEEGEHLGDYGNMRTIRYGEAYGDYRIAEDLGDIRAKSALEALMKKMSPDQIEREEKSVQDGKKYMQSQHRKYSDMYEVPKEYDIHYLNKQSSQ